MKSLRLHIQLRGHITLSVIPASVTTEWSVRADVSYTPDTGTEMYCSRVTGPNINLNTPSHYNSNGQMVEIPLLNL